MTEVRRVYWDACCWIGLINGETTKLGGLEYVYKAAMKGEYQIWTSALSLAEVFKLKSEDNTRRPLDDGNLDAIDDMFRQDFVFITTVDLEIGFEARRLLRHTPGLRKAPDAIHLASALRWSVDALHTYDKGDLLRLSGKLKCRSGEWLTICEPDEPPTGPLSGKEP